MYERSVHLSPQPMLKWVLSIPKPLLLPLSFEYLNIPLLFLAFFCFPSFISPHFHLVPAPAPEPIGGSGGALGHAAALGSVLLRVPVRLRSVAHRAKVFAAG